MDPRDTNELRWNFKEELQGIRIQEEVPSTHPRPYHSSPLQGVRVSPHSCTCPA